MAANDSDESALVVDAVRALRRDHDPRRAGSLAQEVLQRYPHGAQVEEAMAIAMEAAFADGDATGARHWAERYLGTFGTGRFADRARQVLAASPR
jgi:outer membrane protein assembly factor BamD (BamD/ComL family)